MSPVLVGRRWALAAARGGGLLGSEVGALGPDSRWFSDDTDGRRAASSRDTTARRAEPAPADAAGSAVTETSAHGRRRTPAGRDRPARPPAPPDPPPPPELVVPAQPPDGLAAPPPPFPPVAFDGTQPLLDAPPPPA